MSSLNAPFAAKHWADPFGDWPQWRKNEGLGPHRGMDFNGLAEGTTIPASGTGRVTRVFWNNVLGWCVVVYYPSANVYFGYCHLQRALVAAGDEVKPGEPVGKLGNTGTASFGAHLHLTASRQDGDPGTVAVINPLQFFSTSAPAGDNPTPINTSKEDTMAYPIGRKKDGALYTLAPSFIRHETYAPGVTDQSGNPGESKGFGFTTRVVSAEDRIIWCTEDQFFAIVDSMAVPREKVAAVAGGKAWSAAGDARAAAQEALALQKKIAKKLGV